MLLLNLLTETLKGWGITAPALPDFSEYGISPAMFLFIVAAPFLLLIGIKLMTEQGASRGTAATDKDVSRPTNNSVFRRLWWRIKPPTDTMRVDGLVIDRSRKPHCSWLAPTGGGKSASVATIRVDGKRPVLAVTPDLSDPLVSAIERIGGVRWTACSAALSINFLIGSPTEVAERLTEVFRSGGVGAWKRTARMATANVIRCIDDEGESRTLKLIGQRLQAAVQKDRDLKTACAGWVARFLDLADQFGPSIGPDGVDIADLLNRGISVLLDSDSFDHASLGGDVVALGLAEAKRCASLVPTGFRLIFEEAGQLGDRIDLAEPFFRAGRRRNIPVDALTQAESDLNDGINSNIATRVYFAQELKSLQKIAADRLGLPHTDLDPANMADFTAFVAHGRIRRLVHFPKPAKQNRTSPHDFHPTPSQSTSPTARRMEIEEVSAPPVDRLPALPPPSIKVREILDQIDRSGHCHLWTGPTDKDGYGYTRWNGNNRGVHRIVWELAYGSLPTVNAAGEKLEIDHQCRVRRCVKLDHLELVTKAENNARRWRVRGVATKVRPA